MGSKGVKLLVLLIVSFSDSLTQGQTIDSNGKLKSVKGSTNSGGSTSKPPAGAPQFPLAGDYVLDDEDRFCQPKPKVPFYQRPSDGMMCCRGKRIPFMTVQPEVTGECAITTKTTSNGTIDADPLWCAYSCSLKKLGMMDKFGKIVAENFFAHLSKELSPVSQSNVQIIMKDYLGCFKPLKNEDYPCYSPLGFLKCYQDALAYLCTYGMPKNNNFNSKAKATYDKFQPFCHHNRRRVSSGCCHGKPLPWTITEILEASRNDNSSRMSNCLTDMGPDCDATCLLQSINVVNDNFDLDVDAFKAKVLNHFPTVKPSLWMDYTGPVFLFYDEILVDMGDHGFDSVERICRFHDRIMELHESKVEQYCEMSAEEVKELITADAQ